MNAEYPILAVIKHENSVKFESFREAFFKKASVSENNIW